MTRLILALLLAACFVAPYLGAPETHPATPRSAPESPSTVQGRTGAPLFGAEAELCWRLRCVSVVGSDAPYPADRRLSVSGAPPTAGGLLSAPSALAAVTRQGLVSWVAPRYGRFYLALPYPRGTRATICGAGGCVTRTSTDYGPSQRIHPDRIADLSAVDFEYVCAVPRRFGLCNATLTILKRGTGPAPRAVPTAPATNILTLDLDR